MHKINGKKSIIFGHSLGNLHILQALSNIKFEDKELKIQEIISISPPYAGSSKGLVSLLGGDKEYVHKIFGFDVGINFYTQYKFTESCPS